MIFFCGGEQFFRGSNDNGRKIVLTEKFSQLELIGFGAAVIFGGGITDEEDSFCHIYILSYCGIIVML